MTVDHQHIIYWISYEERLRQYNNLYYDLGVLCDNILEHNISFDPIYTNWN